MKPSLSYLFLAGSLCAFALPVVAQEKANAFSVGTIDVKGIHKLISERGGKALLLNFWATWCQPCVEEFPDLIRIRHTYADSILDVVAVSVDYPDELGTKVLPFLETQHASFPVYISAVKKDEELINAMGTQWTGGVPATFVFDKDGRQRSFLFGGKSFASFKVQIDSIFRAQ